MSVAARHENGVFRPPEEVKGATNGAIYRAFSEEELHGLKRRAGNEEDAVYDNV